MGCGTGWLTDELCRRGLDVFGIDLSPEAGWWPPWCRGRSPWSGCPTGAGRPASPAGRAQELLEGADAAVEGEDGGEDVRAGVVADEADRGRRARRQ
ncbi:hypothetical protein [Nonomuraea sp. NPDC050643]|uniref:hypothetical protein n=1 Tax=Nonomuraea sp. NPDC050643 TaxID=3155660 RepID=UPI0033E5ECC4